MAFKNSCPSQGTHRDILYIQLKVNIVNFECVSVNRNVTSSTPSPSFIGKYSSPAQRALRAWPMQKTGTPTCPMPDSCTHLAVHWYQTLCLPLRTDLKSTPPIGIANTRNPSMLLIVLWKSWGARNAKVSRQIEYTTRHVIQNIVDDLTLWTNHVKRSDEKPLVGM